MKLLSSGGSEEERGLTAASLWGEKEAWKEKTEKQQGGQVLWVESKSKCHLAKLIMCVSFRQDLNVMGTGRQTLLEMAA